MSHSFCRGEEEKDSTKGCGREKIATFHFFLHLLNETSSCNNSSFLADW